MAKTYQNVVVNKNKVTIYKMENQFCVSDFIRAMQKALRYIKRASVDDDSIEINCLCAREHIFPDACVPISALIQEYRKIHNVKIDVMVKNNQYLEQCHFESPLNLTADEIKKTHNPLNKIFMYEANDKGCPQAAAINQAFVDKLSKTTLCEEGVLKGMIWCVYEVMDNVILHSKSSRGYVMAQYHKKANRIAICAYDCGIGIKESLIAGGVNANDELEAINLAVQEGVGDGQGQGNGLFGLAQIVKENGGRLAISTGNSTLMFSNSNNEKSWSNNPIVDDCHKSTTVDFQLELSNKTDIKKALKSIGEIDDFDIRIENMVQEQNDLINYKVLEYAEDLGTRQSGKALKTDVLNIIRRKGKPIIIDFSDILIVGSSFIDEFIAKMYVELGSVKFSQLISIKNMNDELLHLCNRAIAMRVNQE
jgi:hypothetical protein